MSGTQASISVNSIDLESMCTLQSILGTTAVDVSTCNTNLENEIVIDLVKNINCADILTTTTSNHTYTSQHDNVKFYVKEISEAKRGLFDILTPSGSNDGNFALAVTKVNNDRVNFSEYAADYAGLPLVVKVVAPTTPYYDSELIIEGKANLGPFYSVNSSSEYTSTFDGSTSSDFAAYFNKGEEYRLEHLVNSRFGRTTVSDPMNIQEHTSFNTSYALGSDLNSYYTLDESTGQPIVNEIPTNNQVGHNNIDVLVNLDNVENTNYPTGTYRVEQHNDTPEVYVNDSSNNTVSECTTLPFFNSTLGIVGSSNYLPATLDIYQYKSIFNVVQEPWAFVPRYNFRINVTSRDDSGYSLSNHIASDIFTDAYNTFSFDNSNLNDNYKYMSNLVEGEHAISFNDASLNIYAGTNASPNNNNQFFSLSSDRETLSEGIWQDNGKILLNINDPTTRVNVITNSGIEVDNLLAAHIFYNNEGNEGVHMGQGKQGITTTLKTTQNVEYLNQLVAKNPTNDVYYALSNGVGFNLFSGTSIVNDFFDAVGEGGIDFSSNYSVSDNEIDIFRVVPSQYLRTTSVFSDNDGTVINNYTVNGRLQNFTQLINSNETLNKLKMNLTLQPLSNIQIYSDSAAAGWVLQNGALTTVSSSNSSAWPEDHSTNKLMPSFWPNLYSGTEYVNGYVNNTNEVSEVIQNSNKSINYKISLVPDPKFRPSSFVEYYDAVVEWFMYDSSSVDTNTEYLNKVKFNSVSTQHITNNDTMKTIVDPSTYNMTQFTKSGASNISLMECTLTNQLQSNFKVNLLPYDNLELTTPVFTVTYTYYLIQYTDSNNNMMTDSTNLGNFVSTTDIDYTAVKYTIDELYQNTPLSFTGTLSSFDLQEFMNVNIMAINDNDELTLITENYRSSAFYNIPLTMEINASYGNDIANATTGDFMVNLYGPTMVPLNSSNGYYVMFTPDTSVNYTVDYFHSTLANLSNDIPDLDSSTNTISVRNGYSNITSWDSSSFMVNTSSSIDGTNILSIVKRSDTSQVVATIASYDFKFLNTKAFITCFNNDIWRVDKYLNEEFTEKFISVNYRYPGLTNIFSPDTGVYIVPSVGTLDSATIADVGYIFDFELLQDSISVSLVGSDNFDLEAISELSYQYDVSNNYSKELTITNYRGYYGPLNTVQTYNLVRDQLVATFSVVNGEISVSQNFNVYKDTTVTVDNLVNNYYEISYGGIGLQITFNESMLSTTDVTTFDVVTIGDDVSFSITNTTYTSGPIPVPDSSSLRSYLLYEFSGSNFNQTEGPLKINSARLKLENTEYTEETLHYDLKLLPAFAYLYFTPLYLGNPATYSWPESTIIYNGIYDDWVLSKNGGYGFGTNNDASLNFQFSRVENAPADDTVSYFVSVPPYYKFNIISSKTNITLPYNVINDSVNLQTRYLPVDSTDNTYYPFSGTRSNGRYETSNPVGVPDIEQGTSSIPNTYTYFNGDVVTIPSTNNETNNCKIKQLKVKKLKDYVLSENSAVRSFVVTSDYLKLSLFYGLYGATVPLQTLFNGVASDLLFIGQDSTPYADFSLNLVSIDASGTAVTLSFTQPLPILQGSTISLSDIYTNTSGLITPDNIFFQISTFFINTRMQLHLPILQGISVNYYTASLKMNQVGSTYNASIVIHKYIPVSTHTDSSQSAFHRPVKQIIYNRRQSKTINLPPYSVGTNAVTTFPNIISMLSANTINQTGWSSIETLQNLVSVSTVELITNDKGTLNALIFGCDQNGQTKATLVNKAPFFQVTSKIGLPVVKMLADGTLITPLMSTNAYIMNNPLNNSMDLRAWNMASTSAAFNVLNDIK